MKKVKLSGKNLEKIHVNYVYFTDGYYEKISKKKTRDGGDYLELIVSGRGMRGFKHLLEKLIDADNTLKIIFTDDETCRKNDGWYINLEEYKKSTSDRFLSLYRKTGLDGAAHYLNQKMPEYFAYRKNALDYEKAAKNLPKVAENIKTKKGKTIFIDEAAKIVDELSDKENKDKGELSSIENIKKSSNIASIIAGLNELRSRIGGDKKYKETSGRGNWQDWLKEHSWIFGIFYNEPYEKVKIGFNNMPDFLFPTLDGFIDLYEIKLPEHEVIKQDKSHPGSFAWSSEANKAIAQCVNYLREIEINQLQLANKIETSYGVKLSFVKPRAFVVIGSDKSIDTKEKREALKALNHSLHGIEVITYSDLERRGEQMLKIYGY